MNVWTARIYRVQPANELRFAQPERRKVHRFSANLDAIEGTDQAPNFLARARAMVMG